MVRGVEAGPGVSLPGSDNTAESGNEGGMLVNESEGTVLLFPNPPAMTERNSLTGVGSYHSYSAVPATPPKPSSAYGTTAGVNPFASPATVPGSLYELHDTDLGAGAPPMPGTGSPAPYGSYTNIGTYPSSRARQESLLSNHSAIPPAHDSIVAPINPFASPAGSRRGSSASSQSPSNIPRSIPSGGHTHALANSYTPSQMHQTHAQTLAYNPYNDQFPSTFGFAHDTSRPDSSHSVTYSEAHVGQAVKVQVGATVAAAPPKYEDLRRQGPLPHGNRNGTRPQSSQTLYDPEDAYGGM